MDSRYSHLDHEDTLYQQWEANGVFNPDSHQPRTKRAFTVIMPPPNANDPLHVGHAMFASLEDIMTRYHRMLGDDTLWLPGTDHAGIETQFVFEKKLKKEGKSRFQFDRTTLYQMIWEYVQANSTTAVNQLKKMGASADWSRFAFMLDDGPVTTALETFSKLHQTGLIYRDVRLVNYCTKCGTAFSELEVKHEERQDPLYYIKYGPFVIATTRPETKFRDTALAVNPTDPRYQAYLGKTMDIPGLLGPITVTIIGDEEVDPAFGTGIMKVSPAHDHHDFELGQRYNLPVTPVIDFNGRMDMQWFIDQGGHPKATPAENEKYLERARLYHGKKLAEMRALMLEDFKADGLLIKVDENYRHNIGVCYRCNTVIEPLPMPQFFIKVRPLVEPVLAALDNGDLTVHGAGHDKILRHWLDNLKDWNISRQIVWGIRFPIWYSTTTNPDLQVTWITSEKVTKTGPIGELLREYSLDEIKQGLQTLKAPVNAEFVVSTTSPGDEYLQETDTFDTWFSSSQWPFSTLKNTQQAGDFERFYPTTVMETGYDILPFWVMRMLMMGHFATGQFPFHTIYLHGLVRDQKGQKMSKSKGNVINPLEIIEKFGADALRMALVIRSSAGLDKSVGEGEFKAMRNFTNKIWNAARFVITLEPTEASAATSTLPQDEAFSQHVKEVTTEITRQLEEYKIGLAADTLYTEFWHWFCDEQIELHKQGQVSYQVLVQGLLTFLKLLHPFAPFVTEAVWQTLRQHPTLNSKLDAEWLAASPWPN